MSRQRCFCIAFILGALLATSVQAEISRADRKKAGAMTKGQWYLRMDVPCTQGRHPYGVFYSPLVEVSATGVNTEADSGATFSWFHASTTVWAVRVNDLVKIEELDWDEDEGSVELELEGAGPSDGRDSVVRFVGIQSIADFTAAFEKAFSSRPLQEEHADWPPEIREAIGKRQLVNGMTKRQAFYVVGTPAQVEKTQKDGKDVEVWVLQQRGMEIGFWGVRTDAGGAPETLRFEDGKLAASNAKTSGKQLDLDH